MKNLSRGLLSLLSILTLALNGPVAKAAHAHDGGQQVAAEATVHANAATVKDSCCDDCDCCEGGECTCEDCECCGDGGCCEEGSCECDGCGSQQPSGKEPCDF